MHQPDRAFTDALKSLGFDVEFRSWPGVAHAFSPVASAQTRELVESIRADQPASESK